MAGEILKVGADDPTNRVNLIIETARIMGVGEGGSRHGATGATWQRVGLLKR
jgi:hypothetical protein